MKTTMSRFQIHDDLTAPDGSLPVLRGALATGGQLPNFLGVLAGSPAALRGYARFRAELKRGTLNRATLERISLAVAEHYGSAPGIALHSRTARVGGPRPRRGRQGARVRLRRPQAGGTDALPKAVVDGEDGPPMHLHEEARELGWDDEQLIEAIAYASLEVFTAMVNVAGDVPIDGSVEDSRTLRAA